MARWRNIYLYSVDHENFKLSLLQKVNNILRMIEATIIIIGHSGTRPPGHVSRQLPEKSSHESFGM
jgi:hypothetical protein